ncbi:MAG: diphthine synthase [Methanoregula sp.]|uniref:diphthine synthase n=1 Tax=Methanoregula sp. TaxID=2052170 RepID=UPI003BB00A9E
MLTFIGLGLYDKHDVSDKGLFLIRNADHVFLENYTSRLMGTTKEELEAFYQKPLLLLKREDVEQHPDYLLECALQGNTVFLCAGDPMVSTTHADLRIRAAERGIPTAIIHGASIVSAICGLSGLQNYRFGKSCSVPFPQGRWSPISPLEVIEENRLRRLHTLVYLDIQDGRYMSVNEGICLLERMAEKKQVTIPLYVGIARAGSPAPVVRAGTATDLCSVDFGPPLHILIVPGDLHDMEQLYLERFAGLC